MNAPNHSSRPQPMHANPQNSPPQGQTPQFGAEWSQFQDEPELPQSNAAGAIVLCCAGVAVLAIGFGIFKVMTGSPSPQSAQAESSFSSPWVEHQNMMREAVDLAKEARDMQREHMQQVREAMMEAEGGVIEPEQP